MTCIVIAAFLLRSLFLYFVGDGPASVLLEGSLFSIVALLMWIRLRLHDALATKMNRVALVSVLGFALCIFTLR